MLKISTKLFYVQSCKYQVVACMAKPPPQQFPELKLYQINTYILEKGSITMFQPLEGCICYP